MSMVSSRRSNGNWMPKSGMVGRRAIVKEGESLVLVNLSSVEGSWICKYRRVLEIDGRVYQMKSRLCHFIV